MSVKKLLSGFSLELSQLLEQVGEAIANNANKPGVAHWTTSADGKPEYSTSNDGFITSLKVDEHTLQEWHTWLSKKPVLSDIEPIKFHIRLKYDPVFANSDLWLYQDQVYEVLRTYTEVEAKLLILESIDKERQKFERLAAKFSDGQTENVKYERTRIPEHVRVEVWRRDQGKCASCGSRENLEYDHIVPVSRGGSNTARNVELLCQDCNRAKGDRIQ